MSSHALVAPSAADREEGRVRKSTRALGRSAAPKAQAALGGEPRVSLLPTEVNDFHRERAVRRRLGGAIVAVLLLVAVGIGGAYYLQMDAQAKLATAQATTVSLAAQEAEFSELRTVKTGTALIEAGQKVGASTEIDWKAYLENLQATLPAGVAITSVTIDSASPFTDYAQSTVPLEGSRVATLNFTAISATIPSVPDFLDGLAKLPGFADAVPGSLVTQEGGYLVNITMHINSDAFTHRFSEEAVK